MNPFQHTTHTPNNYQSIHTPSLASTLSYNKRLLYNSRTFISSRFKFKKTNKSQSHLTTHKHTKISQSSHIYRNQTVSMIKLGEWLRMSAGCHGFGKNVFDLALVMLKEVSNTLRPTYSLAAASLSVACKIDSSEHIRGLKQIPSKTTGRFPRVSISQIIEQEQKLLKALNFNVPIEYNRLLLLLQIAKKWNMYLSSNSHLLKLPLNLIVMATKQNYLKNHMKSVSYLLDLIILTLKNENSSYQQQIYVIGAVVVVGALNCCQINQINNQKYILVRFAKGFLKKCYQKTDQQLCLLIKLLAQIHQLQLWQKISLIPLQPQQKNQQKLDLSEQQVSWKWLNQLQSIPFEEQISLDA